MTPYGPPRPLLTPGAPATPALGQAYLGQTFDEFLNMHPAAGDVIRLVVHGSGTWLGFHVGIREPGVLGIVGWTIGALNGIGALCDAVSIIQRISGTHPARSVCP